MAASTKTKEPIVLPANEFKFLKAVLKSPLSLARYRDVATRVKTVVNYNRNQLFEIALEVPDKVFGDRSSKKTLAQSVRVKLEQRGVIKLIESGNPARRTVIALLEPNVKSSPSDGRGRPKGVKAIKVPKRPRPARPTAIVNPSETPPAVVPLKLNPIVAQRFGRVREAQVAMAVAKSMHTESLDKKQTEEVIFTKDTVSKACRLYGLLAQDDYFFLQSLSKASGLSVESIKKAFDHALNIMDT